LVVCKSAAHGKTFFKFFLLQIRKEISLRHNFKVMSVLLLEIEDSKDQFMIELLHNFSFVKAKPVVGGEVSLLHEIKETSSLVNHAERDIFAEVRGIWADRDIDAKTLRKQAWNIEE